MFCPKCGAEYQPGITTCAACSVPLVERAPSKKKPAPEALRYETVLVSNSSERIAIAKSILMSAKIECLVRGESVQDLFGWGRFPVGQNVFIGPMDIQVSEQNAPDARILLEKLAATESDASSPSGNSTAAVEAGPLWTAAKPYARIAAWLILLNGALNTLSRFAQSR